MDSTSIQFRSHTALLLAAALPYLQPAYRHPVELAVKFLEFSETMKFYREFPPPGANRPLHKSTPPASGLAGILELVSHFIQDPEGLLHSLSPVCTGKEKDIVNMLLNLLQAKSFYENYGDILGSFMSSEPGPDFSGAAPEDAKPSDDFSMPDLGNMADMAAMMSGGDLSSMLSKEQSDTLNLLKNLLDEE